MYNKFNLNITRWMGAFGFHSDFSEVLKFEFSAERERAGEFIITGKHSQFELDPFGFMFSDLNRGTIGLLFNENDVREVYSRDVYSYIDEDGFLIPQRWEAESYLNPEVLEDDADFFQECRTYNEGEYFGHTEAFIKHNAKPRGIIVKREARNKIPEILSVLDKAGLNIPVFVQRGCDMHLSVIENNRKYIIKSEY
ncbi:MAG: hypothetical protein ACRCX8_16605 [Sarcina sp.]